MKSNQKGSKKILGLDLGTTSIGWALISKEIEEDQLIDSNIIKLGVRVNPLTTDEKSDFETGKPLSTNAKRTLKRGARRNLQRYKLRREKLIEIFKEEKWVSEQTSLTEIGKGSTHETLELRAKAAKSPITLPQLARVLLTINKKRGYKSNRKIKENDKDNGVAIDGMGVAKYLYDNGLYPSQYALEQLRKGYKYIPDFYRSDLQQEFDQIWKTQKKYYPDLFSEALYQSVKSKNKKATCAILKDPFALEGITLPEKGSDLKVKKYELRASALSKKLDLELVAIVLREINNDINKSSGYLGEISDRSKILYTSQKTVGEYLYDLIKQNPHQSLKKLVFYRQDYIDEFERIWSTQAKYHSVLNEALKDNIRDVTIFYQRKLKSQKGQIAFCQFERQEVEVRDDKGNIVLNKLTNLPKKRIIGNRVIPKASPLFQEFKIWQSINNLEIYPIDNSSIFRDEDDTSFLDDSQRQILFEELNVRGNLKEKAILKILGLSPKEYKTNYSNGLNGNVTNKALFDVYQIIAEREGYGFDWKKKNAKEILEELEGAFPVIGIKSDILNFDPYLKGKEYEKQSAYLFWHLLYSSDESGGTTENERMLYGNSGIRLKKILHEKYGFKPEYAKLIANISFQDDYGRLCTKAIRRIMPYLRDGFLYSEACEKVGYNHSNSLSKEELAERDLKDKLELVPKDSLRNPVVEKILNQMVNVVNQIIDTYGKPDAIHIELARELKKSASERAETSKHIRIATKVNDEIKKIILNDFGFMPTRNDVIRYKLWIELEKEGHKDLFTNKYIPREKIFSKEIDIEHIIPKAMHFDDSYSNKTLAYRVVNQKKGRRTAVDFIAEDYGQEHLQEYTIRVKRLYSSGAISKGKYKKLLTDKEHLSDGFIQRDLRDSQYIAKEAKKMLFEVFREVVSTTGKVTDVLRRDWDLINVMKELNLPKYKALGMTETIKRWDSGQEIYKDHTQIIDWTKRNDHRHHAMDALAVAFTTHNHIQYINYLSARDDIKHHKHKVISHIERLIKDNGKFKSPMDNFRALAKAKIEEILISHKAKNKVTTWNINKTKKKDGHTIKKVRTPRGQLHEVFFHGKILKPSPKPRKLNAKFNTENARLIINKEQRKLVISHLHKYGNNPKVAFNSKTIKNDPLLWNDEPLKSVKCFEEIYTIRKDVAPGLNVSKVVDLKIKRLLQDRLDQYNGNDKEAFSNLDKNPIWLNKDHGIAIKRVKIKGKNNVIPLHNKKDHHGVELLIQKDRSIPVDYVSTGNNHHVAIYEDNNGALHEKVVSFYKAVARVNEGLPIVDKEDKHDEGWSFLFTMKQNEMFVFPNDDFDVENFDFLDEKNCAQISKHLFRVQKFTNKDYFFRHHLETNVIDNKVTKGSTWLRTGLNGITRIKKLRINHIGQIVQVGEY